MKSYDQSYNQSNLIRTILYYNLSQTGFSYLSPDLLDLRFQKTFQINLLNQHSKSTYKINIFIVLVAPLACGMLLFLTNIYM